MEKLRCHLVPLLQAHGCLLWCHKLLLQLLLLLADRAAAALVLLQWLLHLPPLLHVLFAAAEAALGQMHCRAGVLLSRTAQSTAEAGLVPAACKHEGVQQVAANFTTLHNMQTSAWLHPCFAAAA